MSTRSPLDTPEPGQPDRLAQGAWLVFLAVLMFGGCAVLTSETTSETSTNQAEKDAPESEPEQGGYTPVPNDPALQAQIQEGISERAPGVTITRARIVGETAEIETNIVDPRGPNGSPEAAQALAVCQVAHEITGLEGVRVEATRGVGFVRRTETGLGEALPPKTCWEW